MATDRQQAHTLISYFLKRYKKEFGIQPPGLNRHALAHGFEALVKDYPGRGEDIINFYFDNYNSPEPVWFTYNYGKLVVEMQDVEEDRRKRRELRKQTIERMRRVSDSSEGSESSNQE